MGDMAVKMSGVQVLDRDYYGIPQSYFSSYYGLPGYVNYQPVCAPDNFANYTRGNFHGYNIPSTQMSFNKTDIFDLKCPELDYNTTGSPDSSSITSGAPYAPPSPSQDAKEIQPYEQHGMPSFPIAQEIPSAFPNFSDGAHHAATLSPTWSVPLTMFETEMWQCPSYSAYQLPASQLQTAAPVPQIHFDGLTPFDNAFHKNLFDTSASPDLSGFLGDGLVVPGQLSLVPSFPNVSTDLAVDPIPTTRFPGDTRNDKDDYIQDARRRGLSYKEIKRRGGFTEAESTLRGRHRILSKPKEMRVRKPQWCFRDVILLREAVEDELHPAASTSSRGRNLRRSHSSSKLPWKKISERIRAEGATYPFAGAACAKKWQEIRNMPL